SSQLQTLPNGQVPPLEEGQFAWLDLNGRWNSGEFAPKRSQNALRTFLRNAIGQPTPDVTVWVIREQSIPVPCRLVRWNGRYAPDDLVLELPDTPLLPADLRHRLVRQRLAEVQAWTSTDPNL
ncbi:MAG: hypothetical protein KDA96_09870, partial [Planctomycetaceae bacterium]|nr:hypothetical protein [Planctomycetaceae bacterium]